MLLNTLYILSYAWYAWYAAYSIIVSIQVVYALQLDICMTTRNTSDTHFTLFKLSSMGYAIIRIIAWFTHDNLWYSWYTAYARFCLRRTTCFTHFILWYAWYSCRFWLPSYSSYAWYWSKSCVDCKWQDLALLFKFVQNRFKSCRALQAQATL